MWGAAKSDTAARAGWPPARKGRRNDGGQTHTDGRSGNGLTAGAGDDLVAGSRRPHRETRDVGGGVIREASEEGREHQEQATRVEVIRYSMHWTGCQLWGSRAVDPQGLTRKNTASESTMANSGKISRFHIARVNMKNIVKM